MFGGERGMLTTVARIATLDGPDNVVGGANVFGTITRCKLAERTQTLVSLIVTNALVILSP